MVKTYKFESRAQKLRKADVRVVTEVADAEDASLLEELHNVGDGSQACMAFRKHLQTYASSLPLLLYNAKQVVGVLEEALPQVPRVCLRVMRVLARELRGEFAPAFVTQLLPRVLEVCQQTDILEDLFGEVSLCVKFLIKSLPPLEELLPSLVPFVTHGNEHVRRLASQCFSYVLKKAKSLQCVVECQHDLSLMCYYACIGLHCSRILAALWANPPLAEKVHLLLCLNSKHQEEVWASCLEHQATAVLADWVRMCGYTRFPSHFDDRMNEYLRTSRSLEVSQHWVRARPRYTSLLSEVLQASECLACVAFLGVVSDFDDPHTEVQMHEWLIAKPMRNHFVPLSFLSCTELVYEGVHGAMVQGEGRKALALLLWLRKQHTLDTRAVDIAPWLPAVSAPEDIWLALRASNELGLKIPILQQWRNLSEEITTEIAFSEGPEVITAATLPAAAKLEMQVPQLLALPFLSHPLLRRAACAVVRSESTALSLCWDLVSEATDLSNERTKILALKKLQLLAQPQPAVVKALLGVFWERFTTLWKHVNECLAAFAPHNAEFLWSEVRRALTEEDFHLKEHFPLYEKLVDKPDHTPAATYKECLLKFLSFCPAAVSSSLPSFFRVFEAFLSDYCSHYFVIGFTKKPQASDLASLQAAANRKTAKRPELNRKLTAFLKVFKEVQDLSTLEETQQRVLYDFCLQLLLKKVEEIRVLALECLYKVKPGPVGDIEVLRGLAKDESFKSTALEFAGPTSTPILFLLAGRAFRKCPFSAPALTFLSGLQDAEDVFKTLPLEVRCSAPPEELAACPIKRLSPLLRVLSTCASKLQGLLQPHLKGVTAFVLSVLSFAETQNEMYREVGRLALACVSALLAHFDLHREDVLTIVGKLERGIAALKQEWRPKVVDFLHLLLSNYRWILAERSLLLSSYISALASDRIEESRRGQGFALLCDLARDIDSAPFVLPETDGIVAALTAKVRSSGLSAGALELAQLLPVTERLRELADLLVPVAVKKQEVVELLAVWLPQLPGYPLTFFLKNIPKHRRLLRILSALVAEPLSSVLKDLDAKTKAGLTEVDDFTVQLEALYRAFDLCDTFELEQQKMLIAALNHFLVGTELAKRAQAAKVLVRLTGVEALWPDILAVLSLALRRCKEDEELRTVMQVLQSYLEATGLVQTVWGDFQLLDNLAHLQIPHRVKALKKLCELPVPVDLQVQVFSPLLTYLVFHFSEGKHSSQAYTHALLTALGHVAQSLPWKRFLALLKAYAQKLTETKDDKLLSRAVAGLFEALSAEASRLHQVSLSRTVLPALKAHIVDRQEQKSPHMRKYVVLALFRYISKLESADQASELGRLVILLTKFIRHRDSGTRESAIDCVAEILKTGLVQAQLMHELDMHLHDDRELLAKTMTKVLVVLPHLTAQTAKIASEVLLEYDQPQPFYYLGKLVQYEDLPLILTSTKPLQYVAKGLSENAGITPLQLVELGLELMTRSAMKLPPTEAKATRKEATFSVQHGAATGTRPEVATTKKIAFSDKVFAVRLIKQGIHKAKNVPESLAARCIAACRDGINHTADEIVMTSLEVLRAFKSPDGIDRALTLGETAAGDMLIQAIKYLSAVLKVHKPSDAQEKRALVVAGMGLENESSQTSALKLLRVFMEKGTMHPAIYDTMEQVPRMMLTNSSLRDSAANLYIDFLRSYPLSEKRRDFHIDFLVRNVEFPISTGRLAVAKAINLMLRELSAEGLTKQADFLMLALITALANEDDDDCRKELESALARTMQLNPSSSVLTQVRVWVKRDEELLRKAALVALRVQVDIGKPPDDLLPTLCLVLRANAPALRSSVLSLLEKALEAESVQRTAELVEAATAVVRTSIEEGVPQSLRCLALMDTCPLDLAKAALKYVATSGHVLPHLEELLLLAASEPLVVFTSSLLRKQLGGGDQGSGTLFLARSLAAMERHLRSTHLSLFKAVIIGSDLAKTEELKQAVAGLFQELHSAMPADEFLQVYNAVKAKVLKAREDKRTALKQLMVSNPEA